MSEYWKESLKEVFSCYKIKINDEIIKDIIRIAEMESEATGTVNISDPIAKEVEDLKEELNKERSKSFCEYCHGRGYVTGYFGTYQSQSRCHRCNGEGRR